jgi:hypothetical protein
MSVRVSRMRREDPQGANRFHRHHTTKTSPVPLASLLFPTPSIRASALSRDTGKIKILTLLIAEASGARRKGTILIVCIMGQTG